MSNLRKERVKNYYYKNMKSFNRSGQVNIFTVLFVAIIFISMMALGVGKMINTMIGIGVVAGGVTGIEFFS